MEQGVAVIGTGQTVFRSVDWERTYAEVKKELKGRYPKHPWPDDPWSAPATRRTKKR